MAAYACAMPPTSMGRMIAMPDMASHAMARSCPEMHGTPDHALCQKHCNPDTTAQPDVRPGTVPSSLLAPLPPALPEAAAPLLASRAPKRFHLQQAPPPPAALLFCSLLI
ncbi:hypothetical protein [Frateuria sp.]|uniref:hypothetical protein n=1 Tax=Frateuria sp. TaxID=2211372 RepID=UPI0017B191F0|nr:hypothetical protein [Frateuria sp.]NUR21678.1 hypothetical protein [Frateuria sp.]